MILNEFSLQKVVHPSKGIVPLKFFGIFLHSFFVLSCLALPVRVTSILSSLFPSQFLLSLQAKWVSNGFRLGKYVSDAPMWLRWD